MRTRRSNKICPRCESWMYKEHGSQGVYYCLNCMLEIQIDPITKTIVSSSEDISEYFYNDVYDDDEREDCCVACGNPDYPNCMESCALIDD